MQPEVQPQQPLTQAAPQSPAPAPVTPPNEAAASQPEPAKNPVAKAHITKTPSASHNVTIAIVATVIIVIVLAVLAVFAYQKK